MWIYQNPNWAGLALFLLSAGESMTVVGSFIPGTIVMTAVGIFVGAELLPYWPMVLWAACGTLFGDALNFTLGYVLKDNIRSIWPFKTHQHWLTKGQDFFEKHGGKSIYFARFIGPLRAFAPIIAGAMRMSPSKFYLIDTLSAFTWAIIYLLPGVILGEASLELSPDISEHLFRFVLLSLVILIISIWLIRFLILHISEVIKNALSCLWTKIKETPSLSWIRFILHHHRADHPRGQLGTLLVFLTVLIAFILCTKQVYQSSPFVTLYNNEVYHFIQSIRSLSLNKIMLIMTLFAQKEIIGLIFLSILGLMLYKKAWSSFFFFSGAMILGIIMAYGLKLGIHFHRPKLEFESIDGFSYPSGHVVISTIFYGALAYLITHQKNMKHGFLIYSASIIIIFMIAFSRIFLGVHWLFDIIGGILLGYLCLLSMALFYQRYANPSIPFKKILPLIFALQIILTWGYFEHYSSKLEANYQINASEKIDRLSKKTWWEKKDLNLPMLATNRLGLPKELLNVQWADASSENIKAFLQKQGFTSLLEARNWVMEIQHPESSKIPSIHINFKIRYFDDKKPDLIFYKKIAHTAHSFLVLQLWKTSFVFDDQETRLFLGSLSIKQDEKNTENELDNSLIMDEFIQSLNKEIHIQFLETQASFLAKKTIDEDSSLILISAKN